MRAWVWKLAKAENFIQLEIAAELTTEDFSSIEANNSSHLKGRSREEVKNDGRKQISTSRKFTARFTTFLEEKRNI